MWGGPGPHHGQGLRYCQTDGALYIQPVVRRTLGPARDMALFGPSQAWQTLDSDRHTGRTLDPVTQTAHFGSCKA
eukprot:288127-Chlamydomonas_euryale.AAC.2